MASHIALKGVTKDECEAANAALMESGKSASRTLVVGGWHHVPPGCSTQSGGDYAAHWNTLSGSKILNDGGYTPLCKGRSQLDFRRQLITWHG